jgi:hypothetical protein
MNKGITVVLHIGLSVGYVIRSMSHYRKMN